MARRAHLLSPLLALLACGAHAALVVPVARPRIAHARAPPPVARSAPSLQLPLLGRASSYFQRELVRPLLMHIIISWSALRRHMRGRAQLTRSSFEGEAARITFVGAIINLLLTGFKLVGGIVGCSSAMLADAGHSLSDLLSDGVTLVTLRMSALPPDDDHPYGHGRFESVGSFVVAALLMLAAASFFSSAYASLVSCATMEAPKAIALWAALASIFSKEALFRATMRVGRKQNSQVLMANAWHHRSDSFSSVIALIGIFGSRFSKLRLLDPLAGMAVAGMVGWMGLRIGVEAMLQLTDTSDLSIVDAVHGAAANVDGVLGVDQVRQRSMGGQSMVDLAIQVDPIQSASAAHKIAEEVRLRVLKDVENIKEVLVHVDTYIHDAACPVQSAALQKTRSQSEVESQVRSELLTLPEVQGVSSVLVHYLDEGVAVDVQATVGDELSIAELRSTADRARQLLLAAAPDITYVRLAADLHPDAPEGAWPELLRSGSSRN